MHTHHIEPSSSPTFTNPIIRGFNPDPTICVVPGTAQEPTRFFLSTSTFEYTPSCPIYTSTDLLNWKLIGHALTRPSQINLRTVEPGAGSWASTLRYRTSEKRFYLTTGVFHRYRPATDERIFPRGFYVWTDNIFDDSAWSDPVYFDNPGFDQDLFWDPDDADKAYLSTTVRVADRNPASKLKDFAIHISQIDIQTGRTLTAPRVIRQSEFGVAEGSHILFKAPYYYLFVAEGGTEAGHQEWVFRSTEGVYGPWESQGKPLWYNGPDEEVQRTGHADVFEDGEGRWWAVFLGVRPLKDGEGTWLEPQLGRETFLVTVEWVNGWPVFNEGGNVRLVTKGRDAVVQEIEEKRAGEAPVKWTADLSGEELELGWYQRNTPLKKCYELLRERPGRLRLWGNCYNLSSPEAPAMLLRKQTEYRESFHAKLEFEPNRPGYEAGIVVYWSPFSYATIGIGCVQDGDSYLKTIVCRRPEGQAGGFSVIQHGPFPMDRTVPLGVEAHDGVYRLYAKYGDEEYVPAQKSTFTSKELAITPPVGMSFTGAMFGLYAFGNWEPVLVPADFSDIHVTETTLDLEIADFSSEELHRKKE
ncbi:Arabinanase/levansucrase/invertase [Paraphaeosphaeria sporulosa]|uniref:Arabinanase/levansucrase/invertase n=1 Tax=Paraphaeosphaeria sporulosa TaxID=1460663 RepID=A0A177C4L9_9PLEO|nr:Arabinanase/levansucrase/invertase [Paraphaeosphaeria sporulosa]OAG02366.1 Arabinanase/levansucrase/invertase [Paraphaeosphaeria sporulosa]